MNGSGQKGEGLFIDSRMGGIKRHYHGPKPKNFEMRVSPDLKNSVCFLCGRNADGSYDASGTGFFVSVPSEARPVDVGYLYLITAKHNIDKAKAKGYSNFHLRINTRDGGVDFMEVPDAWRYTDDKVADVAVMQIYELDNSFAGATMPVQMALADETSIQAHGVGIGDEILMVGLFTKRHGFRRNIPIVRAGIIAAMPEEPIEDQDTGNLYDAYLAEIRSIGGLSGSPVLVFKDEIARYTANLGIPITATNGYLLGLIRGHWDITKQEVMADVSGDENESLNTGIAIVTPIKEALSIINGDEFVKERRRLDKLRAARQIF